MVHKMIQHQKFLVVLVIISLLFSFSPSTFAFAQEQNAEDTINGIIISPGDAENKASIIARHYDKNSCQMVDFSAPYSDNYFERDDTIFYQDLAQASFGMTVSAFRDGTDEGAAPDANIQNFFTQAGFHKIQSYGYDTPPTDYSFSCVIASKEVDNITIIAFIGCGSGYKDEWISNLTIGTGVEHEGFSASADLCQERLSNYIKEYGITGDIRLWISGYSRASAVGNLFASHLMDSKMFTAIYAYFFATPNNTRNPIAYDNIFNIIGQNDPVPQVPLTSWGYGRNGRDLFTLSQESNSNYIVAAEKANAVMHEISGISFRNNPDINWQLHVIFEYLAAIFPTVDDFVSTLQPHLISAYRNHNGQDLLVLLREALSNVDTFNPEQKGAVDALSDYLDEVIFQYISGNEQQTANGSWDDDVTLGCNIALEHVAATYLSWILSTDNPAELYTDFTQTNRLVIDGTFDLEIWDSDGIIQSITSNGEETFYVPGGVIRPQNADLVYLYTTNHDGTAIVNLPCDRDYSIKLFIAKTDALSLFSNKSSYKDTINENSTVVMFPVQKDDLIVLQNFRDEEGIEVTQENGDSVTFISQMIPSDVESITARESLMKSAHSVRDVLIMAILVCVVPLLLLLIILILHLLDRGNGKYRVAVTLCLGLIATINGLGIVLLLRILPNIRTAPIALGVLTLIFTAITVVRIIQHHKIFQKSV